MNCIIIDDEETSRTILGRLSKNNPNIEVQEIFHSAVNAITYLNDYSTDLVFLDIHMPIFTGLDFIKTIKDPPQIIMTTADQNYALEAFEYGCIIDYIVKPVSQERFDKGVERALSTFQNTKATFESPVPDESIEELYINIDRRLVKIDIPSITSIEAKGDYIFMKTNDKNYMVHSTLKKINNKLPQDIFFRVHRSYIINTKKIVDIEDHSVLIGKDVIPVSRPNKPELMRRLNRL
ncbi:response regulator transcription factor [Flagellimonas hymeniacidonis]|uniref:Response regulator transcription factor n=1 Tax=Flagellimonas hymeniacidonis TaxID=2603628 RepID=A0A5C8V3C2_9FLAO|nr:LytTR family DNA-binding domain-containing protein [Flagellimonas hymeniacidonis]TXN36060.1 response regulator transcription factor [Flagellimonas hymeniacidonis]